MKYTFIFQFYTLVQTILKDLCLGSVSLSSIQSLRASEFLLVILIPQYTVILQGLYMQNRSRSKGVCLFSQLQPNAVGNLNW
ncbi:hypothetical protein JHK84_056787 [Glycine max]|uniref:Uncharacterized protein n=1 Tax=Glycine max TaxID=3847 RepID=K7N4I8_SOYBN|nr:hypothetical protein JHK85_057760 [Glycine max]KAG5075556.1 hypothetical protein JHK84_056787 [Glycine max]KAH1036998.1 hypothetical protein GYH30_056421 [Glycine max]